MPPGWDGSGARIAWHVDAEAISLRDLDPPPAKVATALKNPGTGDAANEGPGNGLGTRGDLRNTSG